MRYYLVPKKVVSFEEGEALAKNYNIQFFETSAKQDINVEKSFLAIAVDCVNRLNADSASISAPVSHRLAPGTTTKPAGGCC